MFLIAFSHASSAIFADLSKAKIVIEFNKIVAEIIRIVIVIKLISYENKKSIETYRASMDVI